MANSITIKNSTNINLKVTGQNIPFGNQSVISGRKIRTIITRQESAGLKTINGVAVSGNLNNVYLVLVDEQNKKVHEGIPLYLLNALVNNDFLEFDNSKIDWTKSYLYFADNTEAQANINKEIPLLVIFE